MTDGDILWLYVLATKILSARWVALMFCDWVNRERAASDLYETEVLNACMGKVNQ